jgi:hypothetical protein
MSSSKNIESRLEHEISLFRDIWEGGYYEGDPLDPVGPSSYGTVGYISVLHATYLLCIKPYVGPNTSVLEIGPGRGAWTRTFIELGAPRIWCLDARSRADNRFDSYVGRHENIHYHQVSDFSCSVLPEDSFDYVFSFGCFCHISFAGVREYLKNLYPKMRHGAHGFVMVADYEKFNRVIHSEELNIANQVLAGRRNRPLYWAFKVLNPASRLSYTRSKDEDQTPVPGRWYHAGIAETCAALEEFGYAVVSPDVGTSVRDPVIHFRKQ